MEILLFSIYNEPFSSFHCLKEVYSLLRIFPRGSDVVRGTWSYCFVIMWHSLDISLIRNIYIFLKITTLVHV